MSRSHHLCPSGPSYLEFSSTARTAPGSPWHFVERAHSYQRRRSSRSRKFLVHMFWTWQPHRWGRISNTVGAVTNFEIGQKPISNPKSEISSWTAQPRRLEPFESNLRFTISDLSWAFVRFQVFVSAPQLLSWMSHPLTK